MISQITLLLLLLLLYIPVHHCSGKEYTKIKMGFAGNLEWFQNLITIKNLTDIIKFHHIDVPVDTVTTAVSKKWLPAILKSDIVVSTNHYLYLDLYSKLPYPKPKSILISANGVSIINIWNHKVSWTKWMTQNGLGKYTPKRIPINNPEFPCVFKTDAHFGHGVHIIHNQSHLNTIINKVGPKTPFTLQEALTGMGNKEGR